MAFLQDDAPSALEKLIHDCEFENQQYVKVIEHEDTLLTNIEKETGWKRSENQRLEEANSQLDGEVKQLHRQFVQNKENLESQKKTGQILTDQIAAMTKNLDMLTKKRENERIEHDRVLKHYKDICDRYREKYESFPPAQELKKARVKEEELEHLVQEKNTSIASLRQKMQFLLSKQHGKTMTKDDQVFILKLAEARIANLKLCHEIHMRTQEVQALKQRTCQTELEHDAHIVQKNPPESQAELQEAREQEQVTQADVMESPMISVFSGRDEENEEMQTETINHVATVAQSEAEQRDPPQSWLSSFQRLQVHQGEPLCTAVADPVHASVSHPVSTDTEQSSKSPQLPYVAYRKTVSASSHPEVTETVKVHLQQMPVSTINTQLRSESATETIKRTFQQDVSPIKPCGVRSPYPDPAMLETFSQRPKIPKLELRVPTPQMFGRSTITCQTARHIPRAAAESRYRGPVPQVQIPRKPVASQQFREMGPYSSPKPLMTSQMVQPPRAVPSPLVTTGLAHLRPQPQNSWQQQYPAGQRQQYPQAGVPRVSKQQEVASSKHIVSPEKNKEESRTYLQIAVTNSQQRQHPEIPASASKSSPVKIQEDLQQARVNNFNQSRPRELLNASVCTSLQYQQQQVRPASQRSPPKPLPIPLHLQTQVSQIVNQSPDKKSPIQSPRYTGHVQPPNLVGSRAMLIPQPSPRPDPASPAIITHVSTLSSLAEQNTDQRRSEDHPVSDDEIRVKMLGPAEPYFVKLKEGAPENEKKFNDENTSISESECTDLPNQSDALSPFNMKKHQQHLADLKAVSPGCPTFKGDRRMFSKKAHEETNASPDASAARAKDSTGAAIPSPVKETEAAFNFFSSFGSSNSPCTSSSSMFAFGGGDASENVGNTFSLFGDVIEDKQTEGFGMFGKAQGDEQNGEFAFAFGDRNSHANSSVLSLFGSGDDDKGDESTTSFNFSFGAAVNSPEQRFSLF